MLPENHLLATVVYVSTKPEKSEVKSESGRSLTRVRQ